MRKHLVVIALLAGLGLALAGPPAARGEDKGIIALQQSVSLLMKQLDDLQKSFNTSMGMMQGLVSQNTDTVNKLSAALDGIQRAMNGSQVVAAQHQSDISGQFQSLADAITDLQKRLQTMDATLKQIQQLQQTIPAPNAAVAPGAGANPAAGATNPPAGAGTAPGTGAAPAPPAATDSATAALQTALSDLSKNNPDAQSELAAFIRTYPNDPQLPDAIYYLGGILMQKSQYNEAIDRFSQVIEQYPDSPKVPMAELNKGISLAHQGDKAAAISELKALTKNYPGTDIARQAEIELHSLDRPH